ncbi:MAG: class I SAM-dependent methyltransferase [Buchananella hordeovulneris]|nr:class I SAM-dependent methyltransferase [Buchananella hordeovulneris]
MGNWDERYTAALAAGRKLFPVRPSLGVTHALDLLHGRFPARHSPAFTTDHRRSAIDVGAGEGRHARELVRRGYRVTALEGSRVAAEAGAASPEEGISWLAGDAGSWQPPQPADLVLAAYLHSMDFHISSILGNMAAWVRPGGYMVLVGHAVRNLKRDVPGPPSADALWEPDALAANLEALGFAVTFAKHVERVKVRPKRVGVRQDASSDAVVLARKL